MQKATKILTAMILAGGLTVLMGGTSAQAGDESAQQLAKGMEKDAVVSRMGDPDQVVPFPGGLESWTYSGINKRPQANGFVPADKMSAAGSGDSKNLVILFGAGDKVKNYSVTAPK